MKGAELTESGFYWFIPDESSPAEYMRAAGPVVVYVSSNGYPEGTTFGCSKYMPGSDFIAHRCGGDFVGPLEPPETKPGCGARLADGQWWAFCGETDMGQTLPALCTECGGKYSRAY